MDVCFSKIDPGLTQWHTDVCNNKSTDSEVIVDFTLSPATEKLHLQMQMIILLEYCIVNANSENVIQKL